MHISSAQRFKMYGRSAFCLAGLIFSFASLADEQEQSAEQEQGTGSTTIRVSDESQRMANLTNDIYRSVFDSVGESLDLELEYRAKLNVINLLNEYQIQLVDDVYQYLNTRSTNSVNY